METERFSFDCADTNEEDALFDADAAVAVAREGFHVRYLFPWQRLVISNILDGTHKNQLVILPTGAGKSLCFLVPALLLEGATLVLYPLIALMNDQKRRMDEAGIPCVVFKGGQSDEERAENFARLADRQNPAKVILANPEVLQSERLLEQLSACKITHAAIDEAHCVAEWGDSFRPAYLTLGAIIRRLHIPRTTAFTATASAPVLERIGEVLFANEFHLVRGESDRANIHYEVRYAYAKKKAALMCAKTMARPMIIFCGTRRRSEEMARLCASYFGQEKTRFYHAGMTKDEKRAVEQWFYETKDGIIAATCALGMGIDKADVATVVHLDAPAHLENFAQEAGRAGRNGENARSVLIWNHADAVHWRQAKIGSRERALGDFAMTRSCRRQFLLDYLGGEQAVCSGCDVCDAKARGEQVNQRAWDAELAERFIKKHRRLFTREEAVHELTEKLNKRTLEIFGMNVWDTKDTAEILSQLFSERKIRTCAGLWENRLDVVTNAGTSVLALIPRRHRHHLHRLRQQFRRVQERARRLFSSLS